MVLDVVSFIVHSVQVDAAPQMQQQRFRVDRLLRNSGNFLKSLQQQVG